MALEASSGRTKLTKPKPKLYPVYTKINKHIISIKNVASLNFYLINLQIIYLKQVFYIFNFKKIKQYNFNRPKKGEN